MGPSNPIESSSASSQTQVGRAAALVRLVRDSRRFRIWVGVSSTFLALSAIGLIIFMLWPRHAPKAERFHTMVVARGDVIQHVIATGRVEARSTVEVAAPVTGRIGEVLVGVGDAVVAGQLLARVELDDAHAQRDDLHAAVDSAAADARRASVEHERARDGFARARDRFAGGRSAAPELDAARERLAAAVAGRTAAAALGVVRASALTTMANTGIHAPVDGIVIASNVPPADGALFVIATDLEKVRVVAAISASDAGLVPSGAPATLHADDHPKRTFHAEVQEVNARNEVVLDVDNDDHALAPGMSVAVEIDTADLHDVLRVLDAALAFHPPGKERGEGDAVWVLTRKGPQRIPVEIGIGDGIVTAVEGDLQEGDMVIVELTEAGREAYGTDR